MSRWIPLLETSVVHGLVYSYVEMTVTHGCLCAIHLYSCHHPHSGAACSRGPHLEPYVVTSLVQLLCRMTKLCWFDDDQFRSIVRDCKQLLDKGLGGASPGHFLLGLKILSMLVAEFNQPIPGR